MNSFIFDSYEQNKNIIELVFRIYTIFVLNNKKDEFMEKMKGMNPPTEVEPEEVD